MAVAIMVSFLVFTPISAALVAVAFLGVLGGLMSKYSNINMKKNLLLVMIFCLGSLVSYSQNQWDGDDAIGNFGNCNNWYSNSCPSTWNSSTDLLFQYRYVLRKCYYCK